MPKIIIGLVGEIAAGKDTLADYLKQKHQSETISFSQPLREILDILALPQDRQHLAALGEKLRNMFGQDVLAKAITAKVQNSGRPVVCLPNVRLPQDIKFLKDLPNFHLVAVLAEPKTRFERLKKRRQNTDDRGKTWRQFLADAKLPTEIQIRKIARRAEAAIDNNGSLPALKKQIDELMKSLLN